MGNRVGSTPTTRTSTLEQAFLEEMSALIFFIMEKDPMRFFQRGGGAFDAFSHCFQQLRASRQRSWPVPWRQGIWG